MANKEFQKVVAEQRASAKLLGKALEVLEGSADSLNDFRLRQYVLPVCRIGGQNWSGPVWIGLALILIQISQKL